MTEAYQEQEANRKPLVLPKRQTAIGGSFNQLWWTGPDRSQRHKKITSDNHAVATLRKLDSDDNYFQEAGKQQQ